MKALSALVRNRKLRNGLAVFFALLPFAFCWDGAELRWLLNLSAPAFEALALAAVGARWGLIKTTRGD